MTFEVLKCSNTRKVAENSVSVLLFSFVVADGYTKWVCIVRTPVCPTVSIFQSFCCCAIVNVPSVSNCGKVVLGKTSHSLIPFDFENVQK